MDQCDELSGSLQSTELTNQPEIMIEKDNSKAEFDQPKLPE